MRSDAEPMAGPRMNAGNATMLSTSAMMECLSQASERVAPDRSSSLDMPPNTPSHHSPPIRANDTDSGFAKRIRNDLRARAGANTGSGMVDWC